VGYVLRNSIGGPDDPRTSERILEIVIIGWTRPLAGGFHGMGLAFRNIRCGDAQERHLALLRRKQAQVALLVCT
jgi:hypothetical protein